MWKICVFAITFTHFCRAKYSLIDLWQLFKLIQNVYEIGSLFHHYKKLTFLHISNKSLFELGIIKLDWFWLIYIQYYIQLIRTKKSIFPSHFRKVLYWFSCSIYICFSSWLKFFLSTVYFLKFLLSLFELIQN